MKKRSILVLLAVAILVIITGCSYEKKEKMSDAERFKSEYEEINGKELNNGKIVRSLNIPSNNPFIYSSCNDILTKMDNGETFVVYFGFANCPWCRSILPTLIDTAKELKLDKIYYVDVLDVRDVYKVDDNGNVYLDKESSEGYLGLVNKLENVLEDYTITVDNKEYVTGKKRIYAPNIISVVKGKAEKLETGTDKIGDPFGEISDEMKKVAHDKFKCVIECTLDNETGCSLDGLC